MQARKTSRQRAMRSGRFPGRGDGEMSAQRWIIAERNCRDVSIREFNSAVGASLDDHLTLAHWAIVHGEWQNERVRLLLDVDESRDELACRLDDNRDL